MTRKDLDYDLNLVAKARLRQLTPIFEGVKCYQTALHAATKKLSTSQSTQQTSLLSHFQKLPQAPQPSAATTLVSQQSPTLRRGPSTSKDDDSLKAQMVSMFEPWTT